MTTRLKKSFPKPDHFIDVGNQAITITAVSYCDLQDNYELHLQDESNHTVAKFVFSVNSKEQTVTDSHLALLKLFVIAKFVVETGTPVIYLTQYRFPDELVESIQKLVDNHLEVYTDESKEIKTFVPLKDVIKSANVLLTDGGVCSARIAQLYKKANLEICHVDYNQDTYNQGLYSEEQAVENVKVILQNAQDRSIPTHKLTQQFIINDKFVRKSTEVFNLFLFALHASTLNKIVLAGYNRDYYSSELHISFIEKVIETTGLNVKLPLLFKSYPKIVSELLTNDESNLLFVNTKSCNRFVDKYLQCGYCVGCVRRTTAALYNADIRFNNFNIIKEVVPDNVICDDDHLYQTGMLNNTSTSLFYNTFTNTDILDDFEEVISLMKQQESEPDSLKVEYSGRPNEFTLKYMGITSLNISRDISRRQLSLGAEVCFPFSTNYSVIYQACLTSDYVVVLPDGQLLSSSLLRHVFAGVGTPEVDYVTNDISGYLTNNRSIPVSDDVARYIDGFVAKNSWNGYARALIGLTLFRLCYNPNGSFLGATLDLESVKKALQVNDSKLQKYYSTCKNLEVVLGSSNSFLNKSTMDRYVKNTHYDTVFIDYPHSAATSAMRTSALDKLDCILMQQDIRSSNTLKDSRECIEFSKEFNCNQLAYLHYSDSINTTDVVEKLLKQQGNTSAKVYFGKQNSQDRLYIVRKKKYYSKNIIENDYADLYNERTISIENSDYNDCIDKKMSEYLQAGMKADKALQKAQSECTALTTKTYQDLVDIPDEEFRQLNNLATIRSLRRHVKETGKVSRDCNWQTGGACYVDPEDNDFPIFTGTCDICVFWTQIEVSNLKEQSGTHGKCDIVEGTILAKGTCSYHIKPVDEAIVWAVENKTYSSLENAIKAINFID